MSCIARWDGTNWSALGSGLNYFPGVMLASGDGNLYVWGASAPGVVKWDGHNWSTLGSWISGAYQTVLATDASGNLYAAGDFKASAVLTRSTLRTGTGSAGEHSVLQHWD